MTLRECYTAQLTRVFPNSKERLMRYITALLAFSCLAMAQDKPSEKPAEEKKVEKKAPEPRIVTEAEWAAIEKKARDPKLTTVQQIERLRTASKNTWVRKTGRIRDVLPGTNGQLRLLLGRVDSNQRLFEFIVNKDEADIVRQWQKWDRVSWNEWIDVAQDGHVRYHYIYRGVAQDLKRTPNPGPAARKFPKATVSYGAFVSSFRKYASAGRWDRAFASYRRHFGRAFETVAKIVSVDSTSDRQSAAVRVCFATKREETLHIDDAQIVESLRVGDAVVVATFLHTRFSSAKALRSARGRYSLRFEFWKVRGKPKKKE